MLPAMTAMLLGLFQAPPEGFTAVSLRPAVVLDAELEFAEPAPEAMPEAKPLVKEHPAPARTVPGRKAKAARPSKAAPSPKRSGRS